MSALKHFSDIRIIRFKTRLHCGVLTLRRYRWRDVGQLHRLLDYNVLQSAFADIITKERPLGGLICFWLWLHRTFQWVYIISRDTCSGTQVIGFIGIYGMRDTQCAMLSMALFNPLDRGRGYGRQALELLLRDLRRRQVLKSLGVLVSQQNLAALAFFRALGFSEKSKGFGKKE